MTRSKKRKHKDNSSRKDSKRKSRDKATAQEEEEKEEVESTATSEAQNAEDIWKGPAKLPDDKSREEEFEEYLEDLFL